MPDECWPERARRIEARARQRAEDHHQEAKRGADRETRPVLQPGRVDGNPDDRPNQEEGANGLANRPQEDAVVEPRGDSRRAIVDRGSLVRDQRLGQQRSQDAAGELEHDVDERLGRADLADRRQRHRHCGIQVRPRDDGQRLDEHEQSERLDESDDGPVDERLLLAGRRRRDEERYHHRDEEDEREGADELRDVRRRAALHVRVDHNLALRLGRRSPYWVSLHTAGVQRHARGSSVRLFALVRLAALPILLAVVAAVAGCGGSSQSKGPAPLSLALDFPPTAAHAPIYAALRTGADRRHGIRLRILGPGTGTPDSLKLVTSGSADVGVLDIHDLGLAAERGAAVVAIAPLVQRPLAAVIARSGIKRPRDLAGRTVGVTGLPSDVAVLNAVVSGDGGNFSAVKQHTIGFSAVAQMIAGRVDAVTAFWNAEGVMLHTRGVLTSDFRVDRYGAPPYPEVVLFAKRSTVAKRRPQLRGLLAALADGVRSVHRDPTGAIVQIAKVSGADRPLVAAQLKAVDPLFDPPLRINRAVLAKWAAWDRRFGILPRRPNVRRLFDLELAP